MISARMRAAAGASFHDAPAWRKCGYTARVNGRLATTRHELRKAERSYEAMAMTVGVARISLYLEGTFSLKDKRQIVRSISQRVRNQFNAGIAEVEALDDWRVATLGIVVVSNDANHAQEMLQTVIGFVERRVELGVLGEVETELIPYGD